MRLGLDVPAGVAGQVTVESREEPDSRTTFLGHIMHAYVTFKQA